MDNRLKIYACSGLSGIDSTDKKMGYGWWNDGTDTINNTQAVNTLLVKINLCRAQLQHLQLTNEERNELLNAIVMYSVSLYFTRAYDSNYKSLEKAGAAIGELYEQGAFNNPELTVENADEVYNSIVARINEMLETGAKPVKSTEFNAWWTGDIVARNKYGLDKTKRAQLETAVREGAAKVKGIGTADPAWREDADISEYLTKASEYFLYTYFTEKQLRKLPAAFRDKANTQWITYDYCKSIFVGLYGTEEDMQDVIRAGIIGYFDHTPEEVCAKICSGEKVEPANGVGELVWTIASIIAIVQLVLGFLATIVKALVDYAARVREAENEALNEAAINASCPAPEDYEGLNLSDLGGGNKSPWIAFAAIGAGLLLLLKK